MLFSLRRVDGVERVSLSSSEKLAGDGGVYGSTGELRRGRLPSRRSAFAFPDLFSPAVATPAAPVGADADHFATVSSSFVFSWRRWAALLSARAKRKAASDCRADRSAQQKLAGAAGRGAQGPPRRRLCRVGEAGQGRAQSALCVALPVAVRALGSDRLHSLSWHPAARRAPPSRRARQRAATRRCASGGSSARRRRRAAPPPGAALCLGGERGSRLPDHAFSSSSAAPSRHGASCAVQGFCARAAGRRVGRLLSVDASCSRVRWLCET
jgi:hypothetical protein